MRYYLYPTSSRHLRVVLRGVLRHWRMLLIAVTASVLTVSSSVGGDWMRVAGFGLVATGVFCNLLVIGANRGRMPVQTEAIAPEQEAGYQLMSQETKFAILGDWIPVRDWLISPGDVCLYAGVALALAMRLLPISLGQ